MAKMALRLLDEFSLLKLTSFIFSKGTRFLSLIRFMRATRGEDWGREVAHLAQRSRSCRSRVV